MSIMGCLSRLLSQGKISKMQHDYAKQVYDGILAEDGLGGMDQASKEAYAATKTSEILKKAGQLKMLKLARNTQLFNDNLDRIKAHPNGPMAGFMALLDRDIYNAKGERTNVSSNEETIQGQLAHHMHDAEQAYGSKAAGLKQDTTGIRQMVKELFSVKTGDAKAAAAAKGWKDATDWGTKRAKDLGRDFNSDDEWRMPQFWTSSRVEKFGHGAEFMADLNKHIDSGALKVFDPETGKMVDGAERKAIVENGVRNIRKDLSKGSGPGSIFKDEMRVFRFQQGEAGANAYLEMTDKYGGGQGGYFPSMQSHAAKMSRELSMLQLQGPNYRGNLASLFEEARNAAADIKVDGGLKQTKLQKIGQTLLRGVGLDGEIAARRMMRYMTGELSGAESEVVAGIFQGTRSFLTAANMGSAVLTAVPADTVNWAMASNYRGLQAGRLASAIVDQMFKDTPDKEAFATRLGVVAHASSRAAIGTKQFGDQIVGSGIMSRMSDFIIRSQGLHVWDSAIKRAFPMEFLASFGDRMGKTFDQVDEPFKGFLSDYGFTQDEWSKLSAAEYAPVGEAKFLMPDSLPDDLRTKMMSAINDEKQFAYLAGSSNRVRALTTGGMKGGAVPGEIVHSLFLFKQFPISMIATWGARAAQDAGGGKLATAAQLGIFMTMAGALALQSRAVVQGKDPEDMKNPWFWHEAALQGGALGLYGDFIKEGFSRSGTSLTEAALGPMGSIPAALQRLTSGARRAAENGEHTNFGSALASDIQRFTPGNNLWYGRLLFQRYLFDNIRKQVDPDYGHSFARMRENAMKLKGQDFYWAPGEGAPARGPDMGAMLK